MLNVKSYQPKKNQKEQKTPDFSEAKNKKTNPKKFDIKSDPKVIVKATIYSLTTITLLSIIIFSAYKIIRWKAETDATNEMIIALQSSSLVETIKIEEVQEPKTEPEKNTLIKADLATLKNQNPDSVGWIYVPGTSIDYPFVQTNDNKFYLTHSFNKRWNTAGWVFLDYRNSNTLQDKNQIIYAHGRVDGSMFGTLVNVLKRDWQDIEDNHYIKTYTENHSALWQVFSTYQIKETTDYIVTQFNNDTVFQKFIDMIVNRSNYNYNLVPTTSDRILTLSTCIGYTDRAVLHAKLIEEQ